MTFREAETILTDELKNLYDQRESVQIAAWVMEHITGKKKSERLVAVRQELNETERANWRGIKDRLLQGEPIQYVLNEAPFLEWIFSVNRSTLIPRPETEELVAWILSDHSSAKKLQVLDAGTGSGCIAIALKINRSGWQIIAADISRDALSIVKENASRLAAEVETQEIDILDINHPAWRTGCDIIVSNPPYIPISEKERLANHVSRFEPEKALFVPDDHPLLFYEALGLAAKNYLLPGGMLYLEINQAFGAATTSLLEQMDFQVTLRKDLQGNDRMIRAVKKN